MKCNIFIISIKHVKNNYSSLPFLRIKFLMREFSLTCDLKKFLTVMYAFFHKIHIKPTTIVKKTFKTSLEINK